MVPRRNQLLKPPPASRMAVQAVIETVTYRGCTITLRRVKLDGMIRGSYEVASIADGATWQGTSDGLPDSSDPQYLLEVAKCEIDFHLEFGA